LGWLLLFAFIGIPLIEIAVFIKIGGIVGLGPTLVIVVLTAVIGTALLRRQGLATLKRARQQMDQGSLPLAEIFDAVCLLVSGALLLTPGFVTDGVGAVLLVPAARNMLRRFLGSRVKMTGDQGGFSGPSGIIDGEFEDVTDSSGKTADPDDAKLKDNRDASIKS
jgi:UPF0716 protein FxsA